MVTNLYSFFKTFLLNPNKLHRVMKVPISITVNGKAFHHEVEARELLVYHLRDKLRLTGTHIGCDTSSCGACTVLIDGQAAKSCTVLAVQCEGSDILTIEGIAKPDEPHPLQVGFKEEHGLQCGYCTPGMIMTALDLLARNANPTEQEIREGIEGNMCRCTGYHNIVRAIQHAAKEMAPVFS
jgi:aerobic carbon-monoxide dehydrogenase small subunit